MARTLVCCWTLTTSSGCLNVHLLGILALTRLYLSAVEVTASAGVSSGVSFLVGLPRLRRLGSPVDCEGCGCVKSGGAGAGVCLGLAVVPGAGV